MAIKQLSGRFKWAAISVAVAAAVVIAPVLLKAQSGHTDSHSRDIAPAEATQKTNSTVQNQNDSKAALPSNKLGSNSQNLSSLIGLVCAAPDSQSFRKSVTVTVWNLSGKSNFTSQNAGNGTAMSLEDLCGQINNPGSAAALRLGQINFQY
jgi:uncharacterized membrane protein YdfJ with MMPL/SSD domain